MCGIVGYIGQEQKSSGIGGIPFIFEGLCSLEYRGYDSSGISVLFDGKAFVAKTKGKLANLNPLLQNLPANAKVGIGHTRWATHGVPSTANAHPHATEDVVLVHNGIIENYSELKEELLKEGCVFASDTDTEVIAHLLTKAYSNKKLDPLSAIKETVAKLEGAFALGILFVKEPEKIYAVKLGSPMVLGFGDGEFVFASDAMAIVKKTSKVCFLNDYTIAELSETGINAYNFSGEKLTLAPLQLNLTAASLDKQGYRHYMLKEIYEQAHVMSKTIERLSDRQSGLFLEENFDLKKINLAKVKHIHLVACGTAYYAALLGKYFLETNLKVPVYVDLASEYRYRSPYVSPETLFIAVTQSGETADTLACVKFAKEFGAQILSIANVNYSSIPRASDATLYMEAGPEIGVASTKAFTSMIQSLYFLTFYLSLRAKKIDEKTVKEKLNLMNQLPFYVERSLQVASIVEHLASKYYEASSFLFIGRGPSYPIALEGALKLKEISYIHAEGYAGGELKHGPIALVDKNLPIVAIAPQDAYYEKMLSNIEEVRAREGTVIGLGSENDKRLKSICADYIPCPQIVDENIQSILSVIPLQFLAYYIAVKRGTDVDQPRNLAKSVTVE